MVLLELGMAKMMRVMPTTTMAMTAAILMMANQNSVSPKALTPRRLAPVIRTMKTAALAQAGMEGNQYWMKVPTMLSSTMETRM